MTEWLNRLGERRLPHFGQFTLWLLLLGGGVLTGYFGLHRSCPLPTWERIGPASVLSFLPDTILLSALAYYGCCAGYFLGALLWARGWCVPWSGWLTAFSFMALIALHHENACQSTHTAHVVVWFLLIHALWYHACADELRAAQQAGQFYAAPTYPRWVHWLGVFYLGTFYGFSGLCKFYTSGFGWANGVSLQLWADLWGDPHSLFTQQILASRDFARFLQWAALIGESAGLIAVVSRWARPWIGLALIGFHIGQIGVFGWGFHSNMALLLLFFLPFDEWTPQIVKEWQNSWKK